MGLLNSDIACMVHIVLSRTGLADTLGMDFH